MDGFSFTISGRLGPSNKLIFCFQVPCPGIVSLRRRTWKWGPRSSGWEVAEVRACGFVGFMINCDLPFQLETGKQIECQNLRRSPAEGEIYLLHLSHNSTPASNRDESNASIYCTVGSLWRESMPPCTPVKCKLSMNVSSSPTDRRSILSNQIPESK